MCQLFTHFFKLVFPLTQLYCSFQTDVRRWTKHKQAQEVWIDRMNQSQPNIISHIQSYRNGGIASSHVTFPHLFPPKCPWVNISSMNEIQTYYILHVVTVTWPTHVSCHFTAIHKSFPMASCDSKVSIICALQVIRVFFTYSQSILFEYYEFGHEWHSKEVCDSLHVVQMYLLIFYCSTSVFAQETQRKNILWMFRWKIVSVVARP